MDEYVAPAHMPYDKMAKIPYSTLMDHLYGELSTYDDKNRMNYLCHVCSHIDREKNIAFIRMINQERFKKDAAGQAYPPWYVAAQFLARLKAGEWSLLKNLSEMNTAERRAELRRALNFTYLPLFHQAIIFYKKIAEAEACSKEADQAKGHVDKRKFYHAPPPFHDEGEESVQAKALQESWKRQRPSGLLTYNPYVV